VRAEAHALDVANDGFDLLRPRRGLHDNEHELVSPGWTGRRGIDSSARGVLRLASIIDRSKPLIPETTMKKMLALFALTAFVAVPSFAKYIVVLKNGATYTAKAKWTVVNGKALVLLESGQSLQSIRADRRAALEQVTKIGMANANVIDLNPAPPRSRRPSSSPPSATRSSSAAPAAAAEAAAPPATPASAPAPITGTGNMSPEVIEKFDRAYENVGIFEKKIASSSATSVRAEMTVDTEDRVFMALSATSYLMVRNAGVDNARIDMVELFMKTTTGGSAGRFQMSRADAEALNNRTISQQEYFVRRSSTDGSKSQSLKSQRPALPFETLRLCHFETPSYRKTSIFTSGANATA
jgi:hypothetical protein